MIKNLLATIESYKIQLAICCRSYSSYDSMKYYKVIYANDASQLMDIYNQCRYLFTKDNIYLTKVMTNTTTSTLTIDGYFVQNYKGYFDFFSKDEFNEFFIIAETCDYNIECKRLNNCMAWLRINKDINIKVLPFISDDGYSYSYRFEIKHSTYKWKSEDLDSYQIAAKYAINKAKSECLKLYGHDGINRWFSFLVIDSHLY